MLLYLYFGPLCFQPYSQRRTYKSILSLVNSSSHFWVYFFLPDFTRILSYFVSVFWVFSKAYEIRFFRTVILSDSLADDFSYFNDPSHEAFLGFIYDFVVSPTLKLEVLFFFLFFESLTLYESSKWKSGSKCQWAFPIFSFEPVRARESEFSEEFMPDSESLTSFLRKSLHRIYFCIFFSFSESPDTLIRHFSSPSSLLLNSLSQSSIRFAASLSTSMGLSDCMRRAQSGFTNILSRYSEQYPKFWIWIGGLTPLVTMSLNSDRRLALNSLLFMYSWTPASRQLCEKGAYS